MWAGLVWPGPRNYEVWAVTSRTIRTPVGKTNETNPSTVAEERGWGREEVEVNGVGTCAANGFLYLCQGDAKETFTNEVVIGSCSFAAQPVRLPSPAAPGSLPRPFLASTIN